MIKASRFNNANVITCTGPHTCLAPNRINTGVVERNRAREVEKLQTEDGYVEITQILKKDDRGWGGNLRTGKKKQKQIDEPGTKTYSQISNFHSPVNVQVSVALRSEVTCW